MGERLNGPGWTIRSILGWTVIEGTRRGPVALAPEGEGGVRSLRSWIGPSARAQRLWLTTLFRFPAEGVQSRGASYRSPVLVPGSWQVDPAWV